MKVKFSTCVRIKLYLNVYTEQFMCLSYTSKYVCVCGRVGVYVRADMFGHVCVYVCVSVWAYVCVCSVCPVT